MTQLHLDYLSSRLRSFQIELEAEKQEHGFLHLGGNNLSRLIARIGVFVEIATSIENALSRAEWNRRAYLDRLMEIDGHVARILNLMRPQMDAWPEGVRSGNIIPFPARITPTGPAGGDAA